MHDTLPMHDTLMTDRRSYATVGHPLVESTVSQVREELESLQNEDGHWAFDLEADATIPAEYILYQHYLDEIDHEIEAQLADDIRSRQGKHGGWPLFHDGDFNISASVKAYYALKLAGDSLDAPHMVRARKAILDHGGAMECNVFTRITLALFGQIDWRALPTMPVEIMMLPRWFPFHLSKISYWSRTVIVPLVVLLALRPRAVNPRRIDIDEIFISGSRDARRLIKNPTGTAIGSAFVLLDGCLRRAEIFFPQRLRQKAIRQALDWMEPRLNGHDGLGAIFPAMINTVLAYTAVGLDRQDSRLVKAKEALRRLLSFDGPTTVCQPCLSPVWDTALAMHSMMEAGKKSNHPAIEKAASWLAQREITDTFGDWSQNRPGLQPSGWAFQYNNDHYPDLDDTAAVVMALHRAQPENYREVIERSKNWVIGMQSKNGGWGSFDADNTHYYLNHIPFADHGALLDPPTADVSARCISMLAQLGYDRRDETVRRGLDFLSAEQEPDGSWFGRWGTNYIYGTWSVLCAYNAAGEDMTAPHIRRAVAWLKEHQRADGGWGEDGASYWPQSRKAVKISTPSQTAWALLGLMAAGEVNSPEVSKGIDFLLNAQRAGARWHEDAYTAVGFPRVFYLRYHGYAAYFPLWALARYRNLTTSNTKQPLYGM